MKLKEMFEEAYYRCRTVPMEGVDFTIENFHTALDKYDFNFEIGTEAKETAQSFRQRIAQAEAMARADMLRFQSQIFLKQNLEENEGFCNSSDSKGNCGYFCRSNLFVLFKFP